MSNAPNYRCLLGAYGWDHPAWVGAFYPDDMPAEWRLSFYNTEFECVYLPHELWCGCRAETLATWQQDTLPRFRFLLQAPPGEMTAHATPQLAALGAKALLVVPDAPALLWLPETLDLKHLAQDLQASTPPPPRYVLSASADLAQLQQVRTLLQVLGF